MARRRAGGSRSTHPQEIAARRKKTATTVVRALRTLPPAATRGRAADAGSGALLSSLSAASADFTPGGDRSRICAAAGSVVGLQIFPEAAAARRDCVGRLPERAFLLRRAVAGKRRAALAYFSVRRLGSGFDSQCRHDHLLPRNLDACGPTMVSAVPLALCALAHIAPGWPRSRRQASR